MTAARRSASPQPRVEAEAASKPVAAQPSPAPRPAEQPDAEEPRAAAELLEEELGAAEVDAEADATKRAREPAHSAWTPAASSADTPEPRRHKLTVGRVRPPVAETDGTPRIVTKHKR